MKTFQTHFHPSAKAINTLILQQNTQIYKAFLNGSYTLPRERYNKNTPSVFQIL